MTQILTHLMAAIIFYLILENNPKIKSAFNKILTILAIPFNQIKKLVKKND